MRDLDVLVPPEFMIFRRASFWTGPKQTNTEFRSILTISRIDIVQQIWNVFFAGQKAPAARLHATPSSS